MKGFKKEEIEKEKEKIFTFLRSRLFPWNFVLENVEEDAIRHFLKHAIQISKMKGIGSEKFSEEIGKGEEEEEGGLKERITKEVKDIVNDYLFNPYDKDAIKKHGIFAHEFPFAFSQCWVHLILHPLGIKIKDIVEEKAVVELLGVDGKEKKKREIFITDLISSLMKENEIIKEASYSSKILNKKVVTVEGDYIGNVEEAIFDSITGSIKELIVSKKSFLKRSCSISMNEVKINRYSEKFIFKPLSLYPHLKLKL